MKPLNGKNRQKSISNTELHFLMQVGNLGPHLLQFLHMVLGLQEAYWKTTGQVPNFTLQVD